jgi:hypothetical protein
MNTKALALAILVASAAGVARADVLIHARLEAFDSIGNPISVIPVGSDFELRAYVDDVRLSTPIGGNLFGTFAAYVEVNFDGGKVTAGGPVDIANFFDDLEVIESISPGVIQGGGATLTFTNPGSAEQLLFTVPLHAANVGTVAFLPSYLELVGPSPPEWLLFGDDDVVEPDEVLFFDLDVTIVPEPPSMAPVAMAIMALGGLVARRRRASRRAM